MPDARYTGRPAALVKALQLRAHTSQADVTGIVDGPVKSFWLVNAVAFSGTPEEIRQVAADPEVADVDLDTVVHIADGGTTTADRPFKDAGTGDWGLAASNVPAVWSTYGLYGAGVTVGTIDTGVTAENPDLVGKVAAWHDFVGNSPTPRDDNGHGTHTAGTIVGGSAGGAAIGVAPQARLVVAKAMNKNGSGSASALIAAAEWMTDPDGNPATADQPSVINNSWAAPGANDTWFRPMVKRWLELGIVPVFAAGNSGPDAGSVGNPASYPESLAVGAIDADNVVAPFSGRGPVVWDDEDGTGPAAGTTFIKPDISAPGVGITSSVGTGYLSYSGTSMAAPHVAGVAALLRQANTALTAQQIVDTLKATADDLGPAGTDSSYGTGRLDALKAVQTVVGAIPDTTFSRTPPAATRAQTLRYDMVLTGGATLVRTRVDGGAWSAPGTALTLSLSLPQGRHTVEAQAIGQTGLEDPTPASHVVTVDHTKPTLSFSVTRRGETAVFAARVTDRLSGPSKNTIRWSFGDGELARGAKGDPPVRRGPHPARRAHGARRGRQRELRDAALRAPRGRSRAGAEGRAAGSRRGIAEGQRPPRAHGIAHHGPPPPSRRRAGHRRRRPGGLLRPGRPWAPVAKAALGARGKGGFRLVLPIGGLKPGIYALDVRASERGTSLGSLRLTRRIEIS